MNKNIFGGGKVKRIFIDTENKIFKIDDYDFGKRCSKFTLDYEPCGYSLKVRNGENEEETYNCGFLENIKNAKKLTYICIMIVIVFVLQVFGITLFSIYLSHILENLV